MKIDKAIGWDEKASQFIALSDSGEMVAVPGPVLQQMVEVVMAGGTPLKLDRPKGTFVADGYMVSHVGNVLLFSFRMPDGSAGNFEVGTARTAEEVKSAVEDIQAIVKRLMTP